MQYQSAVTSLKQRHYLDNVCLETGLLAVTGASGKLKCK